MKIFIIFALCVAAVYAKNIDNVSGSPHANLRQYSRECMAEDGLQSASITEGNNAVKRPSDQDNCFIKCLYEQMGYINKDGTYNEEQFLARATTPEMRAEKKAKYDKWMGKCRPEAGSDSCKLAACVHEEIHANIPKH